MYDSQVFNESAKMNPPRTNAFRNKVGQEECEDILKMGCVVRELWTCRISQLSSRRQNTEHRGKL